MTYLSRADLASGQLEAESGAVSEACALNLHKHTQRISCFSNPAPVSKPFSYPDPNPACKRMSNFAVHDPSDVAFTTFAVQRSKSRVEINHHKQGLCMSSLSLSPKAPLSAVWHSGSSHRKSVPQLFYGRQAGKELAPMQSLGSPGASKEQAVIQAKTGAQMAV